ncbi:uncharacterized protein LOC108680853 [Hyalella azteca]|uniref:Uncharacterized protein LOC108680853 n=1 Tax=Hyalella azteca TaxID=294128 RepID=A0A8B7PGI5_HYAAZ|nr:uncharacterized protein LOC108680853 [Hyalella azteca]
MLSGVPQGSILSPLLFNVLLSDMPALPNVNTAIYADDVTMYVVADSVMEAGTRLQQAIDAFVTWVEMWSLAINPAKSAFQIFTRKRNIHPIPALHISGTAIQIARHHRLLGLTLDSPTLTWKAHINHLLTHSQKRLNILRVLSGSKFGGSRATLLRFYQNYIRGYTDYGLSIYTSASPTLLSRLDVIHSTAARLIVGTGKSTPLPSLYCEAGLLPPEIHRNRCSALFHLQLLHRPPTHPVHQLYRRDRYLHIAPFRTQPYKLPHLSRAREILKRYHVTLPTSLPSPPGAETPPWTALTQWIHLDFSSCLYREADGTASAILKDICDTRFKGHCLIFTDGSLSPGPPQAVGTGLAIPSLSLFRGWRLDPRHSIIAAELYGILQAMNFLLSSRTLPATICTDSLASLQLLLQPFPSSYTHLTVAIHKKCLQLPRGAVHLQLVPSHSGIQGNEAADRTAKQAATSERPAEDLPFDFNELKSIVHKGVWNFWQAKWTSIRGQFALGAIKPSVHPWASRTLQSRRFATLFARLRLGTASLNKALYQIRQAPSPLCIPCQAPETTHHYLVACTEYEEARARRRNGLSLLVLSSASLLGGDMAGCPDWPQICRKVEQFISETGRFDP